MKIEKWQAAFLPPAPSRNSIETQSSFCSSLPGIFSTQVRWSDTDKRRERGTQKDLCALRENMPQASWKKFQAESAPKPCSGSVTWSIYVCCLFWGCGWYCIVSICTGSHPVDGTPHDGSHTHRAHTEMMGHTAHTPTDKQTNIFAPPTALCTPGRGSKCICQEGGWSRATSTTSTITTATTTTAAIATVTARGC